MVIPEGVETIAERAFYNHRAIREVTLPESLTCIGMEAFQLCMNLAEIHGGENVTRIERDAFKGTPWYKRYRGNETEWRPEDGDMKYIGKVLVRAKRNIRKGLIREGTVAVAADAFADCTLMESVEFPPSVTYIGWRAFTECMCLTHLRVPGTIKRIGWHAFEKCSRLGDLILDKGSKIMVFGVF